MIEAIMYFALGFLIAAAIALTTLPAVWNRAVRLTRRRIESQVPVSLAEIQADKDQVRAEYAMAMRRLEISAEALQWKTAEQAVEIGRQAVSVLSMKAELAQKLSEMQTDVDQRLSDKQAEVEQKLAAMQAEMDRRLAEKQAELDQTIAGKNAIIDELETQGAALREELATTAQTLAETEDTLEKTVQRLAATDQALGERTGALKDAEGRIKDQDQSLAGLASRLEEATALAEARKAEIAALSAEVADLRGRCADFERTVAATKALVQRERDTGAELSQTLASQRGEIEQAMARLAELGGRLAAQSQESERLMKRIAQLEGEVQSRDARLRSQDGDIAAARREVAEARAAEQRLQLEAEQLKAASNPDMAALQGTADKLHAEKTALESALSQAREERAKLQRELALLRRGVEQGGASAEDIENELLRERISDVAAEVVRLTAQLEGPNSPINGILADPVWVNGAPSRREGAAPSTIADRIRALQARSSRA
jgi:chromosome segregation ATPase